MEEYQPNSYRFKEQQKQAQAALPEKRAEKVVTGKVVTKKKSKTNSFVKEIIAEDAGNVGSYIWKDVLIPTIKRTISDIITDGVYILLYGEARKDGKRSIVDKVSYTPYSNYSNRDRIRNDRYSSSSEYSYDDIILASRGEAEDVLLRMDEIMATYGLVRVADLFDLVGVTGNPQDNKYGWTNIRNARVDRVRDGYVIRMPRAMPID